MASTYVDFIVTKDGFTLDVENGGNKCHRVADDVLGLLGSFVKRVVDQESDIEVNRGMGDPDIHLAGRAH